MRRRSHRGGHRPSHDGGTLAVKILSPSCAKSSDRRSASGQRLVARALRPFDQQHRIGGRIEPQFLDLGRIFDPVQIDMPNGRLEILIGLDDGEARARHIAFMAKRGDETRAQAPSCRPQAAPTSVITSPGRTTRAKRRADAAVSASLFRIIASRAGSSE